MDTNVNVGIGDVRVGTYPMILETRGLGSCVGVTMYDPTKKIGGLAHLMLPNSNPDETLTDLTKLRYANYALPFMVGKMIFMGCSKENIVGKLVGGASMFRKKSPTLDIGKKNIEAVKQFFHENSLSIVSEHIEGVVGRSLFFDLNSGKVIIKIYGKDRQEFEI